MSTAPNDFEAAMHTLEAAQVASKRRASPTWATKI
jgi:hypothetical protein